MEQAQLTIGQLARDAKVNVETIRYYQRIGLITEPPKPATGYRKYPAEVLQKLRFIKRAQGLGFNLKEIAELLDFDNACCADVQQQARDKRDFIDKQIADLQSLRRSLDGLISSCSENSSLQCPIIETLSSDEYN